MLGLVSAAASDVVEAFNRVALKLLFPLIINAAPKDIFEDAKPCGGRSGDLIFSGLVDFLDKFFRLEG